jgi:hypothetical protein
MCTVTIHRAAGEILVTMNRDEALVRAPELRPEIVAAASGVRWMAPRDSERGGTWMGVNNHGVVACLLNAYRPGESLLPDTSGRFRTRGEIAPNLLAAGAMTDARRWLEESLDPEAYPSFTLMVASPGEAFSYEWFRNGPARVTELAEAWVVRSSSGWDSDDVREWRETKFSQWRASGGPCVGTLPVFHLLQEEGHAERSPLMRRSWSATRSITQARVVVERGLVELRYWPEPTPETREPEAHCSLRLAPERMLARAH